MACFSLAAFGLTVIGRGQNSEDLVRTPSAERFLDKMERERPQKDVQAADTATDFGVPYSRMIRDVDPPYEGIFRNFKVAGEVDTKVGEAAAQFHSSFFRGLNFGTPLDQRIRPETAELKLGNFYVDIEALSASMLFSDNINQTADNRKADVLASIRLNLGVALQLGDRLQLSARGAFIYLPISGDYGVSGFGIDDLFGEFQFAPLAEARMTYDMHLGHWEVELIDDFSIRHRRLGEDIDFEIFNGVSFDEQEEAGRFRIKPTRTTTAGSTNRRQRTNRLGVDLLEAQNLAGGIITRMLPTDTRFEAGAFHNDRWYYNKRQENLPNTHDYVYANLINEHDNMRFKPFLSYRASTYDTQKGWDQRVLGGIQGPVTDYISFLGSGGYSWLSNGRETTIGRVRFEHNPTPLFAHQVEYHRRVTEPDRDVEDSLSYRMRYIINEYLRAEGAATYSHFEDLDNNLSGSDELRLALRFNYSWGKRATFQFGEVYSNFQYDDPTLGEVNVWTTRAVVNYRHSETLDSRITYWFRIHDSSALNDSYYEHLLFYTLTKYF